MPTLLATDRVAALERHLGVAVATEVVDSGAVARDARLEGVAPRGGRRRGHLILLARHGSLDDV